MYGSKFITPIFSSITNPSGRCLMYPTFDRSRFLLCLFTQHNTKTSKPTSTTNPPTDPPTTIAKGNFTESVGLVLTDASVVLLLKSVGTGNGIVVVVVAVVEGKVMNVPMIWVAPARTLLTLGSTLMAGMVPNPALVLGGVALGGVALDGVALSVPFGGGLDARF